MSYYKLCELCTVRNCHRTPVKTSIGYKCHKRRVYKSAFSFLEIAMDNSPEAVLELLWDHGLQVTKGKKGLRVSRRKIK